MKLKIIFFILIFLIANINLNAQSKSFLKDYKDAVYLYRIENYLKSAEFFNKAIKKAESNHYIYKCYYYLGLCYKNYVEKKNINNKTYYLINSINNFIRADKILNILLNKNDVLYYKDKKEIFEYLEKIINMQIVVNEKNYKEFFEIIDFYKKNKNQFFDKAVINNQLKIINNEIHNIYFIFGQKYFNQKEYENSLKNYLKVYKYNPDYKNIKIKIIKTYCYLNFKTLVMVFGIMIAVILITFFMIRFMKKIV